MFSERKPLILGIVGVSIVFLFIAGWMLKNHLYCSLPEYSGDVTVRGLSAMVEIYRDSMAVPYIFAANDEDAAFALGYLHAQERLFQMDFIRRAGEGKLSEVLGSKTLAFDKMFLTVGIERAAKEMWKQASPETRRILTAYTKGVNGFMEAHPDKLSIEFDILRYQPARWQPWESLVIVRLMAWELNINWWTDYAFTLIAKKLGEEKAKQFLPDITGGIPKALPALQEGDLSLLNTDFAFRQFAGMGGSHIGSNNWVVTGSRSQSGKPIIANDPHLAFQAPGKWYLAVMKAGDYEAAGMTLPGVPAVVIGKNANIAWALTNVMADQADFYYETLSKDRTRYLVDGQWKTLKKIDYSIKVKDSADANLEVLLTHRGPLVSGIHLLENGKIKYSDNPVSMRWQGNDISDEFLAFYTINKAKGWNDFVAGVRRFTVPGQNFLYADNGGNTGYVCGVRIPIRPASAASFAMDGTKSQNDWQGYVSAESMPAVLNPPQGVFATANNNVTPSFPYYVTNIWEPSSRIERIQELLAAREKHSVTDYKKMQMDFTSPYAREITAALTAAFASVKVKDENMKEALKLLSSWDHAMLAESPVPAIYAVFFKYLLRNTYRDELGEKLFNQYCMVANVPYRVTQKLLRENNAEVFDDIRTPKRETRDEILRKSLANALTELEAAHGKEMRAWRWGKLHQVTFKHVFHGTASLLDKVIDIGPAEIGGDGTTIFNTEYALYEYHGEMKALATTSFENKLGPSMRFIYDFAQPEQFQTVLTTGQSGNVLSGHYKDMTRNWLKGGYYTIRTSAASAKANKELLVLRP